MRKLYVKHCSHCKTVKNLPEKPYSTRKNKAGIVTSVSYMCRDCGTERHRQYAKTEQGRKNIRRAAAKSYRKYPERQAARVLVSVALKQGELVCPEICSSCKESKTLGAHHPDYSEPKRVIWLCRQCHTDIHNKV